MMNRHNMLAASAAALCVMGAGLLAPSQADAFCGFYAGGAGAALYNNATQVVLMRDGTKTILSMQNNYQGPLEDFAMVIPVPVVLMEDNVKTLDKAVFDKVDQLSAPRLVEYWEKDPCQSDYYAEDAFAGGVPERSDADEQSEGGVTVEAEFKVGEYEIVILSANDSMGLETWLTDNSYNIPDNAEPVLRPYVEGGMYFFVARIISEEVTFEDGQAVLSPLRFHYDSDTFSLPIRLGLISAEDEQDLLVYILGKDQRYEVANYPNVTIPTNINVREAVLNDFGSFYNELFTRTLDANPGAVVTEYSWDASTCDPCPGPTLDGNDIATLGGDVLSGGEDLNWRGWTLTRLHARYSAENVGEDLVFAEADPIAGGREFLQDNGELEEGAVPFYTNNFQGRYAIRHAWDGPITCDDPQFGRWGGPPGVDPWDFNPSQGSATSPNTSGDDYRAQSAPLEALVAEEVPEIGVVPSEESATNLPGGVGGNSDSASEGGGCSTMSANESLPIGMMVMLVLGTFKLVMRRRS